MNLLRDERGIKGIELGMGLLLAGILAAMAFPLMSKVGDRVDDVMAAADNRAAQIDLGLTAPAAEIQVAGVQLERADDGSTCLWNLSASGGVTGVWQSGALTLHGTFAEKPTPCPVAGDAEAAGFSASPP
ncbi:MAG: hypothetical protein V3R84_10270 [Acidimicrobiia bacterium]